MDNGDCPVVLWLVKDHAKKFAIQKNWGIGSQEKRCIYFGKPIDEKSKLRALALVHKGSGWSHVALSMVYFRKEGRQNNRHLCVPRMPVGTSETCGEKHPLVSGRSNLRNAMWLLLWNPYAFLESFIY